MSTVDDLAAKLTPAEEQAILARARDLEAERALLLAPIHAREAAERAAYEAHIKAVEDERHRLAVEAHDREWGHIVGKTVAAIDADLSGDGLVLTFTDGSRLTCDIEPGFYDSPSTLEIAWRQR